MDQIQADTLDRSNLSDASALIVRIRGLSIFPIVIKPPFDPDLVQGIVDGAVRIFETFNCVPFSQFRIGWAMGEADR